MKLLRFAWDPHKAAANLLKHEVTFEEARTVFYDDDALLRRTRTTRKTRIALFCSA